MNLGWKTISGALLIGLGYAVKGFVGSNPEHAALLPLADYLFGLGWPLVGVGAAHKVAKITRGAACGR